MAQKKKSTLQPFTPKIDRRLLRNTLRQKRKELRKRVSETHDPLPKEMTMGEMFRRFRKLETDMQRFKTHMHKVAATQVPMTDVMTTVDEILQSEVKDEATESPSQE